MTPAPAAPRWLPGRLGADFEVLLLEHKALGGLRPSHSADSFVGNVPSGTLRSSLLFDWFFQQQHEGSLACSSREARPQSVQHSLEVAAAPRGALIHLFRWVVENRCFTAAFSLSAAAIYSFFSNAKDFYCCDLTPYAHTSTHTLHTDGH